MDILARPKLTDRIKFLKQISIFKDVDEVILLEIASELKPVSVKSEETIFKEGDSPNGLFLVEYGCVQLHTGGIEFSIVPSGNFFGEQSLILNGAHSLSASAVTDSQLYYLDKPSFDLAVSKEQTLLRAIILRLVERLKKKSMLEDELVKKTAEIKAKTQTISEQKTALEQIIETKDQLLSIIAHDLKNPFNLILGLSEMFLDSPGMSEDKRILFAQRINHSAKDVYNLLENLLNWGKAENGTLQYYPEEIDLQEITSNNIGLYKHIADSKNIVLRSEIEEVKAYADVQMIDTVVRNLLGNAIKFTESGYIQLSCEDHGSHVQYAVTDSGVGIPAHKIPLILDEQTTYTTRGTNDEKGTGLGIKLCKHLINSNKGELSVISALGVGTTFMFTLPKVQ